jgi:hypothetical protein
MNDTILDVENLSVAFRLASPSPPGGGRGWGEGGCAQRWPTALAYPRHTAGLRHPTRSEMAGPPHPTLSPRWGERAATPGGVRR